MASGWNLWVSLVCCSKDVYRYPYNNYYFSLHTCISSFLAAASLLLYSFFKCFFVLVCYFCAMNITNVAQTIFEIVQKSRSREYNYVERLSIVRTRKSRDFRFLVRGIT